MGICKTHFIENNVFMEKQNKYILFITKRQKGNLKNYRMET